MNAFFRVPTIYTHTHTNSLTNAMPSRCTRLLLKSYDSAMALSSLSSFCEGDYECRHFVPSVFFIWLFCAPFFLFNDGLQYTVKVNVYNPTKNPYTFYISTFLHICKSVRVHSDISKIEKELYNYNGWKFDGTSITNLTWRPYLRYQYTSNYGRKIMFSFTFFSCFEFKFTYLNCSARNFSFISIIFDAFKTQPLHFFFTIKRLCRDANSKWTSYVFVLFWLSSEGFQRWIQSYFDCFRQK